MVRIPVFTIMIMLWASASCHKEVSTALRVFQELPSPVVEDMSAVWMTDSLHGVAVGGKAWESGFILSTGDGGQTWQTDTLLSRKMEYVMFDREGQGYVCGQDFALYRPPGSSHWEGFRVNYLWNRACWFPDSRRGAMVAGGAYWLGDIFSFGPDAFWELDTLHETANVLADVQFSDSATVHAVGLGWVLRSDDAGRSWQRLDVTGDFFRSVHFPDPSTGYICGSSGTLLKTTDGGSSWQKIREGGSTGKRNQPFRALWFANADTGFVVGDDGLFWMTENGGADWSQVEQADENADFTDVYTLSDRGWAVAKNGRIFYFQW
ncbi:MAG: hypothetical protein DYG98_23185 [Haliscomenobacteraceae bacterium CHB4]|nr:Ycf48-like protein [Saprospiraceae bacterium]MCE7925964.1 hypothetical protein [Haliscomenobacteraceae bacterium CHB4]